MPAVTRTPLNLSVPSAVVQHIDIAITDGAFEDLIPLGLVQKLGCREPTAPSRVALVGILDLQRHQAIRVLVRKGFKQEVINDAKDGGRSADAKG